MIGSLGLRQPPSGLVPLPIGAEILSRVAWLSPLLALPFAIPEAGTSQYAALLLLLVMLQAFAFGRRFLPEKEPVAAAPKPADGAAAERITERP